MLWVTDRRRDKAQFKAKGSPVRSSLCSPTGPSPTVWAVLGKGCAQFAPHPAWCQLTRTGTAASFKSACTGASLGLLGPVFLKHDFRYWELGIIFFASGFDHITPSLGVRSSEGELRQQPQDCTVCQPTAPAVCAARDRGRDDTAVSWSREHWGLKHTEE